MSGAQSHPDALFTTSYQPRRHAPLDVVLHEGDLELQASAQMLQRLRRERLNGGKPLKGTADYGGTASLSPVSNVPSVPTAIPPRRAQFIAAPPVLPPTQTAISEAITRAAAEREMKLAEEKAKVTTLLKQNAELTDQLEAIFNAGGANGAAHHHDALKSEIASLQTQLAEAHAAAAAAPSQAETIRSVAATLVSLRADAAATMKAASDEVAAARAETQHVKAAMADAILQLATAKAGGSSHAAGDGRP